MKTLQALILAGAFIVAALIFASFSRYSLSEAVIYHNDLITFRLDRLSGQVYYCDIPSGMGGQPLCSPILGSR